MIFAFVQILDVDIKILDSFQRIDAGVNKIFIMASWTLCVISKRFPLQNGCLAEAAFFNKLLF